MGGINIDDEEEVESRIATTLALEERNSLILTSQIENEIISVFMRCCRTE